jgi:hypothetical protein
MAAEQPALEAMEDPGGVTLSPALGDNMSPVLSIASLKDVTSQKMSPAIA